MLDLYCHPVVCNTLVDFVVYGNTQQRSHVSMSHIVQAKTSVKHPDLALLTQAVKLVAQQHSGGRIADYYLTFARSRRTDAQFAIFTSELERGMGLKIKKTTGELTFIGDYWGHEELA